MHTATREAVPKPRTTMQKIGNALRLSKKFSWDYKDFETPTASHFGENIKILFRFESTVWKELYSFVYLPYYLLFTFFVRWQGSIYCLVWKEFLVYMSLYISITVVHDFALTDIDKQSDDDPRIIFYNSQLSLT